ncbi:HupE/UreJ family protein [Nioella aestuarii]|uniref:HupE/UreJ family protein n=1 Tax=Nioella aestuarii TaxID=1662864 RepID=UPI003D7FF7FA
MRFSDMFPKMVARLATLSILLFVMAAPQAPAHEIDPAISDISVTPDRVTIDIQLSLESILSEMDLATITDTTLAPEAEIYDEYRALGPDALRIALDEFWPRMARRIVIEVDGDRIIPELTAVSIPEVGNFELARTSTITIAADLPEGDAPVRFGWAALYGDLVVRQAGGGEDAYTAFLSDGDLSEPLSRIEIRTEGAGAVFLRYIPVGFEHIVPLGIDHILFVLGLFFFSLHLRPILFQVTSFTLAHTITLAPASLGIVTVSPSIVEPLIAASIVYVGVENIRGHTNVKARTALVFAFGLLHGLGFASVLGDFGITASHFAAALIGFNIGVEFGQLAVIFVALALILIATRLAALAPLPDEEQPVRETQVMYRAVSVVGSVIISLIGAWWTIERVFF